MKRFAIHISVDEVDEDGDDIREVSGVTLDTVSTDAELMEEIKCKLYEEAIRLFGRTIPEDSVSERRPESEAAYVV